MHLTVLAERWESGNGIVLRDGEYEQDVLFCLKLTDADFVAKLLGFADLYPNETLLEEAKKQFAEVHKKVLAAHVIEQKRLAEKKHLAEEKHS